VKYFHDKKPLKCLYSFSVDPAAFLNIFDYFGIPQKRFYFADDNRGTRNFVEFPIAHLQHITHEENIFGVVPTKKMNDFFYIGTILHSKGHRIGMWEKYFKDLSIKNSSLWIPIKANGLFKSKKAEGSFYGQNSVTKAEELFGSLVNEIKTHPMHKGHLYTSDVRKTIAQYKYGMVLRCVSFEDSINPRPVFYTYLDILPFIDEGFDPQYVYIPKELQDKLVVKNSKDIEEKVKYFNEHEDERIAILKDLKELFKIDEYKLNWQEIVKQKFI
jgi:hypothetical protein